MLPCNTLLGVVAATVPFAAADIPRSLWRSVETTNAPTSSTDLACFDSCDCMPKLCTDDAIVKGTTTHLTYLCPETKTIQVTETIFVTVHDSESKPATSSTSASSTHERTTTSMATDKSTLFITKTVMGKHSTLPLVVETLIPVSNSVLSSSTAVIDINSAISEPDVPIQNYTEPTTTVHVSSTSTKTVLQTVSIAPHPPVEPHLPLLQSMTSFRSSMILTNSHLSPAHSSAPILTNPLHPSATASGIWSNTTTSDVVAPSPSSTSVSHSTEVPVSTDGVAVPSAINSTLTLVMPLVTQPMPTPPIPGYSSSSVSSEINSTLTLVMPSVSDDRPTLGFAQFTMSVSDNFVSLPSDTETSWSIVGDESTVTDMEVFPTIKPDDPTSQASVLTVGTFFSSELPPYPTAAPAKRNDGKHETFVNGTISKVYMTTSIALQDTSLTVTVTGSTGRTGTVLKPKPSATTESLNQNGTGNAQPLPAWLVVVVLVFARLLAALF